MKYKIQSVSIAYFVLAIAFVGASSLRLPYKVGANTPQFSWKRAEAQKLGGLTPAGLWQLDFPPLQSSINRLSSVRLLRELGNSVRIALGQRVEWIIWGGRKPLMLFPSLDMWVSRGLTPKVQSDVSEAATTIAGFRQRLAAENWTLVVLPIPTKIGTHRDLIRWPVLEGNLLSRDPIREDRSDEVYGYLRDQLRGHGVTVVDLQGTYRRALARDPKILLYATNDSHWSGAGIDLAAQATSEAIASVSPMHARLLEHPTYLEVEHTGDLAKAFDPKPTLLTWLRPAWVFHDKLVNGEEGRGYVYPTAPMGLVVAVGTSYTGQYTWMTNQPVGFAWQLGLHLQNVDVQNRPIAGHGSFVAFKQFWQKRHEISDEFARQYGYGKPKVVVLEFPIRDVQGIINADPGP